MPPSLIRRAAAYFDTAVVTRVYGSTEVPVTTVGVARRPRPRGRHRRPARHRRHQAGRSRSAPPSRARSARAGPRCWSATCIPRTSADSFDADGYFRTGDLGAWVDDDYLVVTGRAKDIIIRNGENISPKEVEDILVGHPGIAEIAIVGLPDARTGERACAVIVPAGVAGPRRRGSLRELPRGLRGGEVQSA